MSRTLDCASDDAIKIAEGCNNIARALHRLGLGDAATPMGALEAHGQHMGEKMDAMTAALGDIADSLNAIAGALEVSNQRPT